MAGLRIHLGEILVAVVLFSTALPTQGVKINVKNQCSDQITLYWSAGAQQNPDKAALARGATRVLDVGSAWIAGVVWGGNSNRALATLAEFTIQNNAADFYDISAVNAYNLGVQIQPTSPSGSLCHDIKCDISNVRAFCTPDNKYTPSSNGNWEACTNVNGPQQASNRECCCPTANTKKFKDACPDAYSFSKDDKSSTFACNGVTDYNVVFCPGSSTNHKLACPQGLTSESGAFSVI